MEAGPGRRVCVGKSSSVAGFPSELSGSRMGAPPRSVRGLRLLGSLREVPDVDPDPSVADPEQVVLLTRTRTVVGGTRFSPV